MITFKYFGLQTIVENIVRTQEIRVFKRTMRQLVCQMDEWDGLTMEDIRRIEHETAARLEKEIKEGEVKSMIKEEAALIVCFIKTIHSLI